MPWTEQPKDVEWFFDPGENAAVSDLRAATKGGTSTVDFKIDAIGNKPFGSSIEAVVGYTKVDGSRAGTKIDIPLAKSGG
jgi:hypothetical protein